MIGYVQFPTWLRPEIIPGLPIRWYGLMYLVAFAITYQLVLRLAVKQGALDADRDTVLNLFFWAIVGVLIGGRLFSVLIYDPTGYYLRNPLQIILPFQRIGGRLQFTGLQGMSYHGGLVGAVVAVALYCRIKRLPVWQVADLIAASAPLGYTFGRLGNFINGELYGRVTSSPLGVVFPQAPSYPASEPWVQEVATAAGMPLAEGAAMINLPRYPSQLFEAFFEGVFLWAILWFVLRRRSPFPGFLLSMYVVGYGLVRFLVEYLREPDEGIGFPIALAPVANPAQFSPLNFSTGQILSVVMIVAGVVGALLLRALDQHRSEHPAPADQPPMRRNMRRLRKRIR